MNTRRPRRAVSQLLTNQFKTSKGLRTAAIIKRLIPAAATSPAAAWVPSIYYKSRLIIPLLWPRNFSCWKTDTAGIKFIIFFGILPSYTCRSLRTRFPTCLHITISADGIQGNPPLCARLCIYAGAGIGLSNVTHKGWLQQNTTELGDTRTSDLCW